MGKALTIGAKALAAMRWELPGCDADHSGGPRDELSLMCLPSAAVAERRAT
jgi:hypothetical protein